MRGPAFARAKVNLCLHVGRTLTTGRWAGYHPLDSLVVFADFGDILMFEAAETDSLHIHGPMGDDLDPGPDNLILRALRAADAPAQSVRLDKHIPISAGLGGGSANAAATLRHFDPNADVDDAALGADIPVCRLSRTARMAGIGEEISPLPGLGRVAAVLVNPREAVSTREIFTRFDAENSVVHPAPILGEGDLLSRALAGSNDLQPIATQLQPLIGDVIAELKAYPNCQLARMSGSGATCFGLFPDETSAHATAKSIAKRHPDWWVRGCWLGDNAS